MYHLLKGLHEYLTRKEEFSVIIIGLDGAGKTTFLEKIKTLYNDVPGLTPDKIGPTVGQNTGKIMLPSTILQFWDLGGQRGIRNIWHRYFDDCHAVVYVIDAEDRERLSEGWEVFGMSLVISSTSPNTKLSLQSIFMHETLIHILPSNIDSVLSAPQILGVPLLLLANKQDSSLSLSVEEIRHDYEDWHQRKLESARRHSRYGEGESEVTARRQRIASLDVMGVSALEG
ncbi:P-loop containing nucleoside triphosphate hydrolase protein [Macrolepiota fuliginosa MF-IS2]|uniref:P-loop containing nucleoside triphosphate hydrolase protein n=1 Tax=Macrolepiota fuliginosa MF-IS2 TaxID=1400762 RepID=A0A9P5XL52_9AGAR|nr:P-loop containing nucleoside triphosphate hydrolase protein [Macrolepiota fuliginosa MF-IS2]